MILLSSIFINSLFWHGQMLGPRVQPGFWRDGASACADRNPM